MVTFIIRDIEKNKTISIHEGIKEEHVSQCISLAKIETVMKKRPRTMSQKQREECEKKFDERYVIVIK